MHGRDDGWSEYVKGVEEANWRACMDTAQRNQKTRDEAENCEDGSAGCPDCPFKTRSLKPRQ